MGTIYQQVLDLITTSPGNLVYHVVLAFSIAGALQAALNLWRGSEFTQGRRMVIGLGLLLGTRLLLFLGAGLVYPGLVDPHVLLPIVDRAVTTLSLILIIWLWTFPEPTRLADAAGGLLGLLVLAIFMLNWVWWGAHSTETAFNATLPNYGWEVLALLLLALGDFLLIVRHPNGWGYGLAMMGIAFLGHLTHLIFPILDSDFAGAVRLSEMVYFPILWTISHRFNTPIESPPTPISQPAVQEHRQYGVEPKMFQAILSLVAKPSQWETCKNITKTVAEILLADLCLVVLPPNDDGQLTIQCGYDLIREVYIDSVSLNSDQVPMLISAMQYSRPLRLPASSTSRDLSSIGKILNLGRTGHLQAAFVPSSEGEAPLMGIVVISPYSDRRWSHDDQAYLNNIATTLAPILQQTKQLDSNQKELDTAKQNTHSFQTLLKETQAENAGLRTELSNIGKQASQEQENNIAGLAASQKESQELIARLQDENKHLGELIDSLVAEKESAYPDTDQHKEELRLTLQEIAYLQKQLSDTNQQLIELKKTVANPDTFSEDQIEVVTSLIQELRQPMSSIVGYTDLLLGESVGILGALQRKFLERVKASTERMDSLVSDLFQIVTLDTGGLKLRPETVDLGNVIDEAIADTRAQLQERGIVLRVDFPDEMPQLHADHDALLQVLIQLLKNAGAASPVDGEIFLRASIYRTDDDQDYVLMQVADQGGGIPKEDLPRVFSRLYRADNPLIQGIGDTGVGLSIVKSLVEAHNGRIWVDTEMGKGSTFSLLIPLSDGKTTPIQGEESSQ